MALFKRRRPDEAASIQALADELGLTYVELVDEGARLAMGPLPDLPLFREGNQKSIGRLLYGRLDGVDTRMFDFTPVVATDEKRSCVLFTFPEMDFPELYLSPRDRLPKLGETLHERGITLANLAVMERFRVQAKSRDLAERLIGAELQELLAQCDIQGLRIGIDGASILGHVPDIPGADELRVLLDFMREFRSRMPMAAWTDFQRR